MCLIIYKPEGEIVPQSYLVNSFEHNPDGWGMMWTEDGRIRVEKGMDQDSYLETYYKNMHRDLAIHTRWATHGTVNTQNCHPFKVTKDIFMMHNGILSGFKETNPNMSDTWHAAQWLRKWLAPAPELLEDQDFLDFLEAKIGYGNKFVFMRSDGLVKIVNEREGSWVGNLWASNEYSLESVHSAPTKKTAASSPASQQSYSCAQTFDELLAEEDAKEARRLRLPDPSEMDLVERSKYDPKYFGLDEYDATTLQKYYEEMHHSDGDPNWTEQQVTEFLMLQEQVTSNIKQAGIEIDDLKRIYEIAENEDYPEDEQIIEFTPEGEFEDDAEPVIAAESGPFCEDNYGRCQQKSGELPGVEQMKTAAVIPIVSEPSKQMVTANNLGLLDAPMSEYELKYWSERFTNWETSKASPVKKWQGGYNGPCKGGCGLELVDAWVDGLCTPCWQSRRRNEARKGMQVVATA